MGLSDLPVEVLTEIAGNLFLPDLSNFALSCRKFLKVAEKRAEQQLDLKKKYGCIHSFDCHGQYCDWPNIMECWKALDKDQSYTYVHHLHLYADFSADVAMKEKIEDIMSDFTIPYEISCTHKDKIKLNAIRARYKPSAIRADFSNAQSLLARFKIYNALVVCLPNLAILDINSFHRAAVYKPIDDIYELVTIIARCQPQPALSSLHTVRCLHVDDSALSTIVPFMALPSLRTIELNRCEDGPIAYPAGCPNSQVQRIDLLRSNVPQSTILELSKHIIGPCEIRIEWATEEDVEMGDPFSRDCDWDTCLVSPEVQGCPHVSRVMFAVKDTLTCKWRSQRGRERLDETGLLVPRMPGWVKDWAGRDHQVLHNVHEEVLDDS